jgi:predicted P-loop ATPase
MVEGEGCADTIWLVGICATTTLGGSGNYKSYGSYLEDLAGADLVVCPDRDEPGVKHIEARASDFPNAQWLYAPPNDFYCQRLPKSQGLDVSDWLNSGATAEDIRAAVTNKSLVYQACLTAIFR